eukprot:CAMPEP_0184651022 /NCGR_PEP_ID=MMETSP0308-20130426/8578_1 /TAXON_ID=38269 /ORGANISM="Gloeochaete witrockiana, Strain SAG 46.84" /LENGTH=338 /DNA_ID=CAMNT_0027084927 /DNA_START=325 /DNA_END=1341 /DNA_ORIENTATION=+
MEGMGLWNDTCVLMPSNAGCASYVLPPNVAQANQDDLCMMMDFMVGCSAETLCEAQMRKEGPCDPNALLSVTCAHDGTMFRMGGCLNYNQMCNQSLGSAVSMCSSNMWTGLPTTEQANSAVISICNEMTMDGCEKCSLQGKWLRCDILSVYSQLCLAMPDMHQCSYWSTMCATSSAANALLAPFCDINSPISAAGGPPMLMYFHQTESDYILFKSWVPKATWQYALSCIAVFIFAILIEAWRAAVLKIEKHLKKNLTVLPGTFSTKPETVQSDWPLKGKFAVVVIGGVLYASQVGLSFLAMLIVMTYNGGLFISVVGGYGIGAMLFRQGSMVTESACC